MIRTVLTAIAAAFLTLSALAQEAAPARFFIERIEVRNTHRISPKLIVSESLLHEGTEYSEEDLSAASLRLSRLPFLLSVDFALEKGSDRGRYVLIINATETKPFFYLLDMRPILRNDRHGGIIGYEPGFEPEAQDLALGFRWFVGSRGILHVGTTGRRDRRSFTADYSMVAVGYTQYDLFGTRAFATLNLGVPLDGTTSGRISPQLLVGVPLTANQTLTLDFEDTVFERETQHIADADFHRQDGQRLITLDWTYNTTDQPFVPTRGTILRVSAVRSMRDRASNTFSFPPFDPPSIPYTRHLNAYGLDVYASRYWELSERSSVSAGMLAGWANVEDNTNPNVYGRTDAVWRPAYEVVRGGYSWNLWRDASRSGDSRLELEARAVLTQRNVESGGEVFGTSPDNENAFLLSAGWVRRSSFGTLRLGVGYSWGD